MKRPPSPEVLKQRIAHLRQILNSTADIILSTDLEGYVTDHNPRARRLLGGRNRLIGRHARTFFADEKAYERLMERYKRSPVVRNFQTRFRGADGSPLDVDITLSRLRGAGGAAEGSVCVIRDVSRQIAFEREYRRKSQFLSEVLDHSAAMIITADKSGRITAFNPEASRVLGYPRDEVIGKPAEMLYLRRQDRARLLRRVQKEGRVEEYNAKLVTRDRTVIDVSLAMSLLKDDEERMIGTVAIGRDVTQERRLERKLHRLSITDTLTKLYNRRYFYKMLRRERRLSSRNKTPFSLILFDVDRFKEYNDRHGHLAGDRILKAVARIIHRSVRRGADVPCRFGGDEFTILLREADAATGLVLAERIRRRFVGMALGSCTLSIGVAQHEKRETTKRFIQRADEAMYAAKRAGGNRVEIA